ncbi:MAG: hypothetical protein K1X91_16805 [Bacteriodetes bacterium]|nr:hypothetical protein [Bacteroidota bacterium]
MQAFVITVIGGGNVVEGAHVDVKDSSHVIIASGTTDVHGQTTLTTNNAGTYTAYGKKMMMDGEYIGEQTFITDPSGTTNVTVTITKV